MTQLESSLDSRLGRIEAALFKLSNDHVASPTTGQGDAIFSWDEQLTGGSVKVSGRGRGGRGEAEAKGGVSSPRARRGLSLSLSLYYHFHYCLPSRVLRTSACSLICFTYTLLSDVVIVVSHLSRARVFQARCLLPLASSRTACTA